MASGRGGSREGAGRKKKAEAYIGEATTAVRIPTSVAEPLLALLSDGKRVAILEAGSQPSPEVESLKAEHEQLTQQRDELDRELNTLHEQNGDLHVELSHLQEKIGDLQHQIDNLHSYNDVQPEPSPLGLQPEAVPGAIAALLEAINTPANMNNRGKVAQALRLLGAEVPEGKARGKRQKS